MDPSAFETLLQRIRRGDQAAAQIIVEHFEPELRRVARVRLRDPRLRSLADSIDISQSVFGRFFDQYVAEDKIQNETQMMALLVKMTKNRLIDLARKHKPAPDGHSASPVAREVCQLGDLEAILDANGPSTVVASADLAAKIREQFSEEEYEVLTLRNDGQSWESIADALGRSAEAVRKQLGRALERVRTEMVTDG